MTAPSNVSACPACDLLQNVPALVRHQRANCRRCGHVLATGHTPSLQVNLALATTVLVLLVIANVFPMMSLELEGQRRTTTVLQGINALWHEERYETAMLVLFVTIVAPLLRAIVVFAITIPLMLRHEISRYAGWIRLATKLTPWGMTEVYLLGALVAFVKLNDIARVEPGPALFAFAALSVVSAVSTSHLDAHRIWGGST